MRTEYKSVDEYINSFPDDIRKTLEEIRAIIKEKAPEATEGMAYGMPAYKTNGKPLVYFAGFERHIGFYATPSGHSEFKDDLSGYKQGKGSVQFPIGRPVPFDLIERIVEFRVMENNTGIKKVKS